MSGDRSGNNISIVHNLVQRTLGLPYKLHITPVTVHSNKDEFNIISSFKVRTYDLIKISKSNCASSTMRSYSRPRESGSVTLPILDAMNEMKKECIGVQPDEQEYRYNKIYCSQWINNRQGQVVFGTKCNHLVLYDIKNKELYPIFCARTLPNHNEGIKTLALNPSGNLLATVGRETCTLAVYGMPNFNPLAQCDPRTHKNILFDICWIDDRIIAVASKDRSFSLWKLNEDDLLSEQPQNFRPLPILLRGMIDYVDHNPFVNVIVPVEVKETRHVLRAIAYDRAINTLMLVTPNCKLMFYDCARDVYVHEIHINGGYENTCVAYDYNTRLGAVGTWNGIYLLDSRMKQKVSKIYFKNLSYQYVVRSLNFTKLNLTFGGTLGTVNFFDLRSQSQLFAAGGPAESKMDGSFGYVFN